MAMEITPSAHFLKSKRFRKWAILFLKDDRIYTKMKKSKYIIGIDEVGRGALAGPVAVAALAMPQQFKCVNPKNLELRDSKRLSPKQREIWFQYIKRESKIFYATATVLPKIIDKINISNAANLAATLAFNKLVNSKTIVRLLTRRGVGVYLDGGLRLNIKSQKLKVKSIIRGDEKIPAISLASIVAKVSRDRKMLKLHNKYPKYGFDKHKGYGTKQHFMAIKKHGPSKIHRLTFLKKIS